MLKRHTLDANIPACLWPPPPQPPVQPGQLRPEMAVEDRICVALESIMGGVDWWKQPTAWVQRLGELLDVLRVSEGRPGCVQGSLRRKSRAP
jgi:hypothetical protein